MHSNFHEVITIGLDRLVASLRARMIPTDQYSPDRAETLKRVIARINLDHGPESEVYLLAHWVLQVHELLHAHVTVITPEIALSDLERMQELANLLRLNEEYELLDTLRVQVEQGPHTFTDFRAVSGGYTTIEQVTTAMLEALGERMAVLGGMELRPRIGEPVALLTALGDSETMSRYLLNGSRNRLTQCVILAHMVMIMREFQRLAMSASPVTAAADALRLAQLAEVVGVQPGQWAAPTVAELRSEPETEPPSEETEPPVPAETPPAASDRGLTIDLSQAQPTSSFTGADREAETVSSQAPEEPPVEPPAPPVEPPEPEPDLPEPQSGSGIGRMIGMLFLAFAAIALLILFVVRPPWLAVWLDAWEEQSGGLQLAGSMTATEVPTPTVAPLPTATATPVPPTATPTPEPTSPALADIVTANTNLALYAWPHLAAEVMGTIEQGTVVIPVQVVTGSAQRWLRLNDGYYVLEEAVDNVPRELPAVAISDLEGMPDFSAVAAATPEPETEAPAPEPEPGTTEPSETEPAATEPSETEPAATEPTEPEPTPTEPSAPYLLTTTRMRAGPGEEFQDKGELAEGTLITPIGTSVDATWFLLDNRYWIPVEVISQVVDGLTVQVPAYALVDANLREGPTANSRRVGGVQENDILVLVGQRPGINPDGIWYQLDTGSWIFGGLVGDAPVDLPEVE